VLNDGSLLKKGSRSTEAMRKREGSRLGLKRRGGGGGGDEGRRVWEARG